MDGAIRKEGRLYTNSRENRSGRKGSSKMAILIRIWVFSREGQGNSINQMEYPRSLLKIFIDQVNKLYFCAFI